MSCSVGEVGSSPFSFRLSVCPMFSCDVFRPRIGRFRFGGFSKVGIRGCKVCRTKYYLSLRGWRFFQATARRPDLAAPYNPGITFAPATKMTTDAVWKAAWEHWHTFGEAERKREKSVEWRDAPWGKSKGGATDKGKATLSCRRDGSPVAVIVMRAWLAVAGVPPAAFVIKRSCPPLPCPAKAGQDGLVAGYT